MPGTAMEEVWKDISLSNLHQDMPSTPSLSFHHHQSLYTVDRPAAASSSRGVVLQDFFLAGVFEEANPAPPPSTHPPVSNSPSSGHFFSCDLNASAGGSDSKGGFLKRSPEELSSRSASNRNKIERKKKRMIMNRESAARSRARKQAYTNELEIEVARLLNENKILKRQYEELRLKMAAPNPTASKRRLQRTSTAPF